MLFFLQIREVERRASTITRMDSGDINTGGAKTLYVGNLDISVTEDLILALFGQIGPVKGCKIIREPGGGDPYAFVEFTNHQAASAALTAMNRRRCLVRNIEIHTISVILS